MIFDVDDDGNGTVVYEDLLEMMVCAGSKPVISCLMMESVRLMHVDMQPRCFPAALADCMEIDVHE